LSLNIWKINLKRKFEIAQNKLPTMDEMTRFVVVGWNCRGNETPSTGSKMSLIVKAWMLSNLSLDEPWSKVIMTKRMRHVSTDKTLHCRVHNQQRRMAIEYSIQWPPSRFSIITLLDWGLSVDALENMVMGVGASRPVRKVCGTSGLTRRAWPFGMPLRAANRFPCCNKDLETTRGITTRSFHLWMLWKIQWWDLEQQDQCETSVVRVGWQDCAWPIGMRSPTAKDILARHYRKSTWQSRVIIPTDMRLYLGLGREMQSQSWLDDGATCWQQDGQCQVGKKWHREKATD
jgi:hypothetical protein